jgi:hypothetical protein
MQHLRNTCSRNAYVPRVSSDRIALHQKRQLLAVNDCSATLPDGSGIVREWQFLPRLF